MKRLLNEQYAHLQEPFVDIPEDVIRDALKVLLGNL
jgi:hypothetical protein